MKLEQKLQRIELILSDVDGVLTPGDIIFDQNGNETKRFHVRDGMGIQIWQHTGHQFGIVTARTSNIVKLRANELGIDLVRQGQEDKLAVVEKMMVDLELSPEQMCFIGDDLTDLACIQWAGVGVAVADAVAEVCTEADLVTRTPGGKGAVRELVETILKAQQRWEELTHRYYLTRRT